MDAPKILLAALPLGTLAGACGGPRPPAGQDALVFRHPKLFGDPQPLDALVGAFERAHAATNKTVGIRARTLETVPADKQDTMMPEFRKQVQAEYDAAGGPMWRAAANEVRLVLSAKK